MDFNQYPSRASTEITDPTRALMDDTYLPSSPVEKPFKCPLCAFSKPETIYI